jgi:hypothetical protein
MNTIYFFILILFVSCKSVLPQEVNDNEFKEILKPHSIFYFFKATHRNTDVDIKLINTKIVKGKTKGNYSNHIDIEKYKATNWLVSFQNNHNTIVSQLQITNPLTEEVEFINDKGNLEKKRIKHLNKDFVIRLPYDSSIKIIIFEHLKIKKQEINKVFFNQIRL